MRDEIAEPRAKYGGRWTKEKLEILEKYLDAYTTALKNKPFKLLYIDAFAGTGYLELGQDDQDAKDIFDAFAGTDYLELGQDDQDARDLFDGSARRAVDIDDKPFDKLIFVEKDPKRCAELKNLRRDSSNRNIWIENSDANDYLRNLQQNWQEWRGILFLDPFGTQVEWSTIETIASFHALDTWILFPVSAISRILPKLKRLEDIDAKWGRKLTKVYGDKSWQDLYRPEPRGLFPSTEHERTPGVGELLTIYKNSLADLFGNRFLQESRTLKNSRNAPMFEFLFCVGNEKGIGPAKRIAEHILEHM